MNDITLSSQNPQTLFLTWPKHDLANRYRLEYLTDTFAYHLVSYLEQPMVAIPRENFREHHPYRITFIYLDEVSGQEFSLGSTSLFYYKKPEPLALVGVKSHEGGTLSFHSESHFDLYRVYNVMGSPQLLVETEDCQVTGSMIKEGTYYQVEGYKKDESGQLELVALSEPYCCQFLVRPHLPHPTLSVVVPVYNCEAFLSRTVDSILASSFQELELILVNDGSTDGSGQICDWYQENYHNIRVIHKENSGPSASRNQGLDRAKGEFMAFVDSDDLVHPYMYHKLYQAAVTNGTDIAIAQGIMRTAPNQSELVLAAAEIEETVSTHSYAEMMARIKTHKNIYWVAVWNKIVRTSVAKKVRFLEAIPYYEDTAYTSSLYTYIDRFTLVKGAYYIWDKRKQNTVGTASTRSKTLPTDLHWRYYLLTIVAPLFQGNRMDPAVVTIYSLDIVKQLLEEYKKYTLLPQIKDLFHGMLKFYVREYQIPVDSLQFSQDDKLRELYTTWLQIKASSAAECTGWEGIVH